MTNSGANYDPTFVECTGFGQNTSNSAPSLFVESIAIDLDCSVYGSLFVTNDGEFGKSVTIQVDLKMGGSIFASGTLIVVPMETFPEWFLLPEGLSVGTR